MKFTVFQWVAAVFNTFKRQADAFPGLPARYSAKRTLDYFEGNFDAFRRARRISSDEEAEAILLGRHNFDHDVDVEAPIEK